MSRLRPHLEALYAPADADALAAGLAARIERFRVADGAGGGAAAPLTERDALLITYADQVRAPGEAPLATLGHFARAQLRGLVSGIHLLPFYP